MRAGLIDEVSAVLRHATAEAILPHFRNLHASQVEEKTPGEMVTIADREAERIITPRLRSLLPGSRVVGEEAAAETPALMDELDEGDVWLVDPLDGTANFIAGSPEFSVMVALLRRGQTVAAWLLDPVADHLAVASLGAGAFINGARVHTETTLPNAGSCRGAVLTRFLPEPMKARVTANSTRFSAILPGARCSGVDYPAVATGKQHFVMFWRLLPWDHAPGALLVSEAGGHVARLDGSRYHPSDRRPGLLVAQNEKVWHTVSGELLKP
jgi:fructose-1,6-bisphosphatase/inositol monophosphatase family enzyme